jgi:polysaccharide export outer membrane protein
MLRSIFVAAMALIIVTGSLVAQDSTFADTSVPSLQPGDMVRVAIWREEDLSGDFVVDEHGVLTLPMIGQTTVTGIPVDQLRDQLIEAFQRRLRNPSIIVTPLRRVNVLGEVQKPGLYPVDLTFSLADVLAIAGGATSMGDLRKIRIMRDGKVIREGIGIGEQLSTANIHSGDQIIVERRSWIAQNWLPTASFGISAISILIALLR